MPTNTYQVIPRKKNDAVYKVLYLFMILAIILSLFLCHEYTEDLITGSIILLLIISVINHILLHKLWQHLALRTNLTFEAPNYFKKPSLHGKHRDHSITLGIFSTGGRGNRRSYTYFDIILPFYIKDTISIKKRRVKVSNKFQIKDTELNQLFTFSGDSPQTSDYILRSTQIRQGFLELHPQTKFLSIDIGQNEINYVELGLIKDPAYLHAVLDFLIDIAESLKKNSQSQDLNR